MMLVAVDSIITARIFYYHPAMQNSDMRDGLKTLTTNQSSLQTTVAAVQTHVTQMDQLLIEQSREEQTTKQEMSQQQTIVTRLQQQVGKCISVTVPTADDRYSATAASL
jgi:septal ring factor EnvC (AmiA/AmiB activator)